MPARNCKCQPSFFSAEATEIISGSVIWRMGYGNFMARSFPLLSVAQPDVAWGHCVSTLVLEALGVNAQLFALSQ